MVRAWQGEIWPRLALELPAALGPCKLLPSTGYCLGMRAYKLLKRRRDGSLGPPFIHQSLRIPLGVRMEAEDHPTVGYAPRPGWHCFAKPEAPHLKKAANRVWCEVEVEDYTVHVRPERYGGMMYLAKYLTVLRVL